MIKSLFLIVLLFSKYCKILNFREYLFARFRCFVSNCKDQFFTIISNSSNLSEKSSEGCSRDFYTILIHTVWLGIYSTLWYVTEQKFSPHSYWPIQYNLFLMCYVMKSLKGLKVKTSDHLYLTKESFSNKNWTEDSLDV